MRKLFSILVVALLALSAHATVVTTDWTFSDMSSWEGSDAASFNSETGVVTAKAWKGVGNWGAINRVEYDKLVIEVATHEQPIYVKIKTLNIGEEVEESNYTAFDHIMPASQNCYAFDLSSAEDVIKWIELSNWSNVEASFTIKRIYALKTSGIKIERPLWNGENAFGNWDHSISVDPFARVYEYDEMVITYTKESEPQCQIRIRETDALLDFVGDYVDVSGATQASFLLSAADVAAIKSNGFYLNGKNMTITDVQIVSHRTLASGEKEVNENWNDYYEIDAGMLADLQIGNNICVRVTNIASGEYQRVSLYSGWSNSDLLAGCEHFFGEETASEESPRKVCFPVTGSMKQQLGSHNLLVRGCNFTMTDVYVEEGTPVAETGVNGYLTVSAAGMATFMLPFNVSSLPDGVQAYNLTNNGDATIWAEKVTSLTADQPVLIIADAGEYKFVGGEGASADITSKTGTYPNGALVGTYTTIDKLAKKNGDKYNYILQNGSEGVGFYQVRDESCSVAPYRAYLSCGYDATPSTPAPARAMRIVFRENTTTGVDNIESAKIGGSTKFLRNGQLYILRNGVEYNVNGQMTK